MSLQTYKFNQNVRDISSVPKIILFILFFSFSVQLIWHEQRIEREIEIEDLPLAPKETVARFVFLDEKIVSSKLMMLWLQAFDNQYGVSLSFTDLNYNRLVSWLDLILKLDPRSEYPLLSASRIYTEVPDDEKKKKMLAFVKAKFLDAPKQRWQWMAHAVYIAKHRLKDLDLALMLAKTIRENTGEGDAPYWARQMEIFILEDKGELESAKILIGGLLESGELNDPHQQKFLSQRLAEIEKKE